MGRWLVAGLGNPGSAYETTRHNMGFLAADLIARRMKARFTRTKWKAVAARCEFAGEEVLVLKPHTYMNLSGVPVKAAMEQLGIGPDRLIAVYDDMDLAPGRIRVRPNGSAGGHKGMKSIIAAIGSEDFARVRVGIGRPPAYAETVDFVLERPDRAEAKLLSAGIAAAAEAVEEIIVRGVASAASKFNGAKAAGKAEDEG
ncbi:MAG: aminoacyl-tRNA hydrolase [Firmicutes bacterium]|nr:aminoacyl-tRNA hydrolase [Bacillota bacterium]